MTPELLTEQERLQCSNQGKRYPVLAKLLAAYEALVQQVAELEKQCDTWAATVAEKNRRLGNLAASHDLPRLPDRCSELIVELRRASIHA